jgi:hypothetical protein
MTMGLIKKYKEMIRMPFICRDRKSEYESLLIYNPEEAEKFHIRNKLEYISDHRIPEGSDLYNDVMNDKIDIYKYFDDQINRVLELTMLQKCNYNLHTMDDFVELGMKILDKGIEDREIIMKIMRGEMKLDDV